MKETVDITLETIHQRLIKSKQMMSEPTPINVEPDSDQARLREFHSKYGHSKLARSDELVDRDDLRTLNIRVSQLRQIVLSRGAPILSRPDYIQALTAGRLKNPNEYSGTRYLEDNGMFIRADSRKPKDHAGERLAIDITGRQIAFGFDFDGRYWISIEYGEDTLENDQYAEYREYLPLEGMTIEEFSIIGHFVEEEERVIHAAA